MISERGFLSCSVEASAAERSGPARRSHFCIRTLRALSWRCLRRSELLDFHPPPSFRECGACLREQEPVVIAVDDAQPRDRPASGAAASQGLPGPCARGRGRDDPSIHGSGRRGACGTRRRQPALPVPLHGARRQEAGRPCRSLRRRCGPLLRRRRGLCPSLPLVAGGKSYGGRMTSGAQAASPLPGVLGLVFFERLSTAPRRETLPGSCAPSFRSRDSDAVPAGVAGCSCGSPSELEPLCVRLGSRATLKVFEDADHSFHVRARSGRTDRPSAPRSAGRLRCLDR